MCKKGELRTLGPSIKTMRGGRGGRGGGGYKVLNWSKIYCCNMIKASFCIDNID
jgi:hypothetical protein